MLYKTPPLFMQNKANFKKEQMNVSSILTKDYENECLRRPLGKQSQSKPTCGERSRTIYSEPVEPIKFLSGKEFRPKEIEHFSDFSVLSQHIEQVLHIFRQWGFEFHNFTGCWVFELETVGVKGTTVDYRFLRSWPGVS
jgi:hypothetical protein